MFKQSLIIAIAVTCFNIHASAYDPHQQKFQEFSNSISPSKIAHDEYLTKKHCEKTEDAAVKYPHTEKCFYAAAVGVVLIAGSYWLPTQQTRDALNKTGWTILLGFGGIGTVSVVNENFHAMMDSNKKK
jgi:hypothetical protein